ncbi:MAG: O-antigen ligase family protein [Armatimonadota bacterium]|jgi:O-antigen ligase
MVATPTDQDRSEQTADRLSLPLLLLMILVITRLTRFTRASLLAFAPGDQIHMAAAVDLDPSKLIAAILVALFVAALILWPRRHLIRIDWPLRFLILFIIYAFISTLWAYNPKITFVYTLKMVQWPLLYIVIISVTRSLGDLQRWGQVMLIGCFVILGSMVFERYAPPLAIGGATPEHTTHAYLTIYPQWAVFFLPFAVHYIIHGRSFRWRQWGVLAAIASLLTVYLSFRRAGPVGIFAALAVYLVLAGWRNRSFVAIFIMIVLAGILAVIIDPSYAARLANLPIVGGITFDEWSDRLRMFQYIVGFEVFAAHPIVGVGLAGAQPWGFDRYGISLSQHNLILKLASETGVVGLVMFGAFAVSAVRRGLLGLRDRRAREDLVGESWCAAIIASLLGILIWAQIQPMMQALPVYLAAALASSSTGILRKSPPADR